MIQLFPRFSYFESYQQQQKRCNPYSIALRKKSLVAFIETCTARKENGTPSTMLNHPSRD